MRLLDRYLLRELALPLGYCLSGILIFWVSFDLISHLDELQSKQLSALDIAELYLVGAPELVVLVLPMALLLALLYALTNHARHHELVAMRAAGLSYWRLAVPYLAVGLIASLGLFYLNERCVPQSEAAAEQILNRYQKVHGAAAAQARWHPLNFKNEWDNRIWNIGAFNLETHQMLRPQVEWSLPDGSRRHIIAERAEWTNGCWTFFNVEEPDYQSLNRTQTNRLAMAEFSETPDLIMSEIKVSSLSSVHAAKRPQLSIAEIRNYLRLHRRLTPEKHALLITQFHGRLAEPWTCLVVVLVALPFGAVSSRRNVFVGVASSIFICFAYFVLLKLGLALGTAGYLPPWLAAWFPNLLFGALGAAMTWRVR
jgi:lipopolysaccharide export system permease protein